MRVSLGKLFAATTLVAASIALVLLAYTDLSALGIATRTNERLALTHINNLQRQIRDQEVTIEDLEQRLEPKAEAAHTLVLSGEQYSLLDPWGKPLQFIENELGQSHVYSLGLDGITRTEGNDPDDISSWNGAGLYYARLRSRIFLLRITSYLISLLVLVGSGWSLFAGVWRRDGAGGKSTED